MRNSGFGTIIKKQSLLHISATFLQFLLFGRPPSPLPPICRNRLKYAITIQHISPYVTMISMTTRNFITKRWNRKRCRNHEIYLIFLTILKSGKPTIEEQTNRRFTAKKIIYKKQIYSCRISTGYLLYSS